MTHKPYPEIEPIPDPPTVISVAAVGVGVVGGAHLALAVGGAEVQQGASLLALVAFGGEGQQMFNLVAGLVEIGLAIALTVGLSNWRKASAAWFARQRSERAHLMDQTPTDHHHD